MVNCGLGVLDAVLVEHVSLLSQCRGAGRSLLLVAQVWQGGEGREGYQGRGQLCHVSLFCKFHLGLQCAQEEIDKIFRLFDVEGKGHIASS